MIVINLKGGLGNQLFQYALGRHLALLNHSELTLDTSSYKNDNLRKCRLHLFNIPKEIRLIERSPFQEIKHKLHQHKSSLAKFIPGSINYVRENGFEFDPNILKIGKNSLLDGYWQSEKYFTDISSILHNELTLRDPLSLDRSIIRDEILNRNSVALHIRRGDYAMNPITTAYHGLCSVEWYKAAADELITTLKNPHFYIFTDDYEWVKSNIKIDASSTFIKPSPDGQEAQDLILMSQCKHNIISNSSFSWWGAWLNRNLDKKVIAPINWFSKSDINTSDLLPINWIKR